MPKIIENLREQIIEEAKNELFENGYGKTTIRSVAGALGIGTGTIYNYFKSKEQIFFAFMIEDWKESTARMAAIDTSDSRTFLFEIYEILREFIDKYSLIFNDLDAEKEFAPILVGRHKQLRSILGKIILPVCQKEKDVDLQLLSEHIAESLLNWTLEGVDFERQYEILRRIL